MTVATGMRSTADSCLLRAVGTIVAIRVRGVAANLAANRAAVATECVRDLGIREALFSQRRQHIPLSGGDLVIRHDEPFLSGRFVSVPDRPHPTRVFVALTS